MTNPNTHKWQLQAKPELKAAVEATEEVATKAAKSSPGMIAFAAGAGITVVGAFLMMVRDAGKSVGRQELIAEIQKKQGGDKSSPSL